MDYGAFPPEVNSARMYSGPGAGSLLAAAAVWDGLAAELQAAATASRATLAELTAASWQGPSSVAMTAAVHPYLGWLTS
ncbi:MAG TPA: PPE domain-containing protein, partial [Mycobacterium sp.]|nr:PPE domain-containing protein [Mycobacterium sp.]